MRILVLIYAFLTSSILLSQEISFKGEAHVLGILSSGDTNPFWMYSNTQTQIGNQSNFSSLIAAEANYPLTSNATISVGSSFFYRDNVANEFERREVFVSFKNNWLQAHIGAKSNPNLVNGLSVSNQNFLWSNNARALPGIQLESAKPIQVFNGVSLGWGIGHYQFNEDRFVSDVNLHFKKLALFVQINDSQKLQARITHYAQWGGTSPVFGSLPNDFEAFVDVFFARKSEEIGVDGEIQNAVGNHLGSFYLDYSFSVPFGSFLFYHDHPFEDGSGTAFKNFPDGIWGIQLNPQNNKLINTVLYEFVTTKDQSDANRPDNYFSNNVYRNGWSYGDVIIGMPFIGYNPTIQVTELNSPIVSNSVQVHHFGVSGSVKQIIWQFKSSIVSSFGTLNNPFPNAVNTWHNYLFATYQTKRFGDIMFMGGWDTGDLPEDLFAVSLGYRYQF